MLMTILPCLIRIQITKSLSGELFSHQRKSSGCKRTGKRDILSIENLAFLIIPKCTNDENIIFFAWVFYLLVVQTNYFVFILILLIHLNQGSFISSKFLQIQKIVVLKKIPCCKNNRGFNISSPLQIKSFVFLINNPFHPFRLAFHPEHHLQQTQALVCQQQHTRQSITYQLLKLHFPKQHGLLLLGQ